MTSGILVLTIFEGILIFDSLWLELAWSSLWQRGVGEGSVKRTSEHASASSRGGGCNLARFGSPGPGLLFDTSKLHLYVSWRCCSYMQLRRSSSRNLKCCVQLLVCGLVPFHAGLDPPAGSIDPWMDPCLTRSPKMRKCPPFASKFPVKFLLNYL